MLLSGYMQAGNPNPYNPLAEMLDELQRSQHVCIHLPDSGLSGLFIGSSGLSGLLGLFIRVIRAIRVIIKMKFY